LSKFTSIATPTSRFSSSYSVFNSSAIFLCHELKSTKKVNKKKLGLVIKF
jgi:hypothetical protein